MTRHVTHYRGCLGSGVVGGCSKDKPTRHLASCIVLPVPNEERNLSREHPENFVTRFPLPSNTNTPGRFFVALLSLRHLPHARSCCSCSFSLFAPAAAPLLFCRARSSENISAFASS